MGLFYPTIVTLNLILAPALQAEVTEEGVSLRELCRKNISGQYISWYDQVYRAKKQLKHFSKKEGELAQQIKVYRVDYDKKKKAAQSKEYNASILNARDHAKNRIDTSVTQLKELRRSKTKISLDLAEYQQKLAKLKPSITAIFTIKTLQEKNKKNYPISIEYKSRCPKYRFMCKLPGKDIYYLKIIVKQLETPVSCERYISFSQQR